MTSPDDDGDDGAGSKDESARELARKGMANLPRNDDDAVVEETLIEYIVVHLPDPDLEAVKRTRARSAIRSLRGHVSKEIDGQLTLGVNGAEWDYLPDRLVLSDDDTIVEQHRATLRAKAAEMERAAANALAAQVQATRRRREYVPFSKWVVTRMDEGAKRKDLTFGRFVQWHRETHKGEQ